MSGRKQSVKKSVWYIGRKKRKQKGRAIPFGLIPSLAAPILGELQNDLR